MASFSRLAEENLSMLEETYEETDLHLVNSTNSTGGTPLHFSASLGHYTRFLIWVLKRMKLHRACKAETLDDPKHAEMMNKDGLMTNLHCAAMTGSVEILGEFLEKSPSCFNSVTLEKDETVFHFAARHKRNEDFILMAKSANLGQLLYQLDVEGNTVLHVAASVGSLPLVKYIVEETQIEVDAKNKKGFVAFDLLNKDDKDFLQLSTALMCGLQIVIEQPPSPREVRNSENQVADEEKNLKLQEAMLRVQSRVPEKLFEIQLEALQNARNTLTIVGVLIASVAFTGGINPPGGVFQGGELIGKSTVGSTFAFTIFSISNSIALFTSVCMVIFLVSIIPYTERSLLKFLRIAQTMMWVAVAAMASAYVSAASVTLPQFGETIWLFDATLAIAGLTLGGMFVYLRLKLAKCMLRIVSFLGCFSTLQVHKNNGSLEMAANISKEYYSI